VGRHGTMRIGEMKLTWDQAVARNAIIGLRETLSSASGLGLSGSELRFISFFLSFFFP
jgi:hypothetical protein